MRNDVKLGLAVGGILLAVLIVYVLVVPSSDEPGAELVTIEEVDTQPIDRAEGAMVRDDAQSDPATEESADQDAVAQGDADATSRDSGMVADSGSLKDPFANAQADADGEWDWNKLLNPADTPELMSPTVVPTGQSQDQPAIEAQPTAPEPSSHEITPQEPIATDTVPPVTTDPARPDIADPDFSTPPASAGATKHTVAAGETFSSIALATYGHSRYYPHIMRANPDVDPARLKPGTVINLPPSSEVKATADSTQTASNTSASTGAASVDATTEYRVAAGDSLERISIKLYGNRGKVNDLFELNKEAMGNDPARLKIGQVLKLPSTPTVTVAAN